MVGREGELSELKTFLDKAREGHGHTVFITGEAGVGKTRLLEELKGYAREQGVDVLQGWSLYESLTPYMPFLEALRSGGLESLFAEEAPRVEAVYLVSQKGLTIKEVIREETRLDSDIFSGMLTVVGDFVRDSLSFLTGQEKEGSLNTLGYENYRILIERLGDINLAVILTGRENEFLINDMKEVLVRVNQQYGAVLKDWDGSEKSIKDIQRILEPLITSGKYDGIDYAKDDPKSKRNRLFENILLGIERHTIVSPSLLCIEDLQWADPSSVALIHYIARNTRKCNLLILGTYRPEDISTTKDGKVHHLIEAMQLMSREDLFKKIELKRLEQEHIEEMLQSFFEHLNFPDEFKRSLHKETDGNPFFIISMIRMLIEEGTINKEDHRWILTKELNEANIPSKVYDVILRRLQRVKEPHREVLDFASVIGEEFTSEILVNVTQTKKIELLKQLRILEQDHRLIRSLERKYKFDHAKIKEVLYQHIPSELRMEYHRVVADSIEKLNEENLDNIIEDLAYHYYYSSNRNKALSYLIKVAEKAKMNYSNEEAILFFNMALEIEEQVQKKIELYISLGDVYQLIGDFEKSFKAYNNALGLSHEKKRRAEIMVKMGIIYSRLGENDKSIKICNEAVNLVKGEKSKTESDALLRAGMLYFRLGNPDQALEYYSNSLEIKNEINDLSGMAYLFKEIGGIYWQRGNYEKALEN